MKSTLSAAALAVAALCASAPASSAVVMSFSPSAAVINVGQSVIIDFSISGLGAEILSGFDLNFIYNPAVLNWTNVQYFGANLGSTLGLANNGLPNGNLGFDDFSLDDDATLAANQADSFTLFRFTFTGMADGVADLTLGLDADFERNLVGLDFNSLTGVIVEPTTITVRAGAQVPEPASYGLAGLALLAAGVAGRSRRRKVAVAN